MSEILVAVLCVLPATLSGFPLGPIRKRRRRRRRFGSKKAEGLRRRRFGSKKEEVLEAKAENEVDA